MNEELNRYRKEPDPFWQNSWRIGDGYDVIEAAEKKGWRAIGSWGRDGYDLGSWPYVIIFFRRKGDEYQLIYYVEGDVTMYICPTKEIRQRITDELALFHWHHNTSSAPDGIERYKSVDELPDDLRGPYRSA
jgi:hypothetical protein